MIKIGAWSFSSIHFCSIQADFEEDQEDPLSPRRAQKKDWALLYDPELLLEEYGPLLIEDFRLS